MFSCIALAFLGAAALADLPALAAEVEAEARELRAESDASPALAAGLDDFSSDAMALSLRLEAAGVARDLPHIFRAIAEDARVRAAELRVADTAAERETALSNVRALMRDAILIAPMAGAAGAEAEQRFAAN